MAIAYVAGATNTGGNTITINKPTGTLSGHVMIAEFLQDVGSGVSLAGWTQADSVRNTPSNGFPTTVLYKVAGGSEPSSYTFTASGGSISEGAIWAYSGVDNVTPLDATTTAATGIAASIAYPSITVVTTGAWHLALSENFNALASQPTGYTRRTTGASWTTNSDKSVSGTVSGVTSSGGGEWVARSVLLRPASGGGATNNKTLTATIGSNGTLVRSIGAIRKAQATELASILRSINTTKSATQGSSPVARKSIGTTKTATQANAATAPKQIGAVRSASIASTPSIVRAIGAIKSAAQGSIATAIKAVSKTVSASSALSAAISTIKAKIVILIASIGSTALVSKSVAAVKSASVTTTATLSKAISKTFSAASSLAASISAIKVKILILSASIGTSASKVLSVNVARGAAINSSVSIKRAIAATRTGAIVTNAAAVKAISKAFNATISQIASIIATTGGAASFIVGNVNVFHIQARSYIAEIPKRSATALIAARAYIYKIIKK